MARWLELLTAFVDANPVVLWIGGGALVWQALALLVVVAHIAWAPSQWKQPDLPEGAMTEIPPWHEARVAYVEDTDYRMAQEDWPRLLKHLTLHAAILVEVGDPEAVPDTRAMSDAEVDAELLSRGEDLEDLEKRGRELSKRARERAEGQWEMTALGMWRRVRH